MAKKEEEKQGSILETKCREKALGGFEISILDHSKIKNYMEVSKI